MRHLKLAVAVSLVALLMTRHVGVLCGEEGKRIPISSLKASEEMPPRYGAAQAADRNESSHWVAHNALPQWIRIEFAQPCEVDTLRILEVSQQQIYDNWRRVGVSFSDGSAFAVTLSDDWHPHTITFPARTAQWIKLTIESAYKQTHYVGCEEIEARFAGHGKKEVEVVPKAESKAVTVAAAESGWQPDEAGRRLLSRLSDKPCGASGHPNLWVNADDVERAKRNIRARRWAFEYYRSTLRLAEEWTARSDEDVRRLVPKKSAVFDNKALCPKCEKPLVAGFDHVGQAYCANCKIAFPNEQYADAGEGWKDPKTGKQVYFVGLYNERAIYAIDDGLRALADAYALTGEEQFARTASVLFDAIAVIYPTCDKGPKWYPGVGGRLNRPFYQAARALIHYTDEYDLLYASPEWERPSLDARYKTRRDNVEENFLKNGGEYCRSEIFRYEHTKSLNNGFCDYLQGMVAVGRLLGIQSHLDYALESELSIFNFIETTIDRDGQYMETAFMYSSHTLDLFSHHAEMLRYYRSPKFPQGINLYDNPKLKLAFLRSERDVDCAGHVPPLGDTGPDVMVIPPEESRRVNPYVYRRLEFLAARCGHPEERARYVEALRNYVGDVDKARAKYGLARWAAFNGAEIPEGAGDAEAAPPPVVNTLLPASRGIGVLRAGQAGETAALLRWGATLNHGSPDELNLNFFALGREVTFDPGYLWAHARFGWTHATGAHNLVVVNEQNQLGQPGSGGDLEIWLEAPGVRAVSANDPACYAKEGVSRYQRTLMLMDLSPTQHYLLDIFRVAGGKTHDLNWHFLGEMNHVEGLTLPAPETTGSLAGKEYEWWKLIRPDGWLKGVNQGFYWSAPPGNGYGFIYNLQRATPAGACSFDWKLGERLPAPRWTFTPAAYVAETSGKAHRPLEIGSHFYRAEAEGDFIEFVLPAPKDGDYLLLVVFYKSTHYGIIQASLDGAAVGAPVNAYSPSGYFADPISLGRVHLTAGEHKLRFSVTGKDPESQGYFFSIKYFAVETPDFLDALEHPKVEGVRLSLAPPPNTQIIVGRAKSTGGFPDATYVVSRRTGDNLSAQFVSVVEPRVGEPQVVSVDRLQPASSGDAEGLAALRIAMRDGRVDYVFESPVPAGSAEYSYAGSQAREAIRFGGRFGVASLQDGKLRLLALYGNGELEAGGRRVEAKEAELSGQVEAVDAAGCAVITNANLPSEGLAGCVVQFSNPLYSRRSAFLIKRVTRDGGKARIELDAASLVMARGLVGKEAAAEGVIPNLVPLDRERMVKRSFRTLYFQGKAIVGDDGKSWGRVKDVSVENWYVTSSDPIHPPPGERFSIIELTPGDGFTILRTTCLSAP